MKTDILIEPKVKGSEQLYKEIYIVIHTAYIVYTMQLKCCCFYTRSSKHVKRLVGRICHKFKKRCSPLAESMTICK